MSAMYQDIRRIGELSKDGVFIYDLNGETFEYVNENFAALFHLDKKSLIQHPALIFPLIRSEDTYYLRHRLSELQKDKSVPGTEFRLQLEDGTIKHLCCEAYLLDRDSKMTGFLKDITRDKEHEDYIINYGAKKDTLLDMMTHNLSGPLMLSQNILRWMQETYKDKAPGEISSQLMLIQENTRECLDIINDFLKEEHQESEKIYVKKTRFDILDRIKNTLEKLVLTNKNKKFRLITDLHDLNISADSVKFFQVIHNLVSNAIKFTPDNGEIDILVEEKEKTFVVRVKDNGIGIPENFHQNIFDKRTTAGRTGINNEASTGLGLSIVKTLTELMGGSVSFKSDEGKGSVFSVEFPKD
ncbi:MAG: ATP-binding protein [Chitinophagaceae bacterium]